MPAEARPIGAVDEDACTVDGSVQHHQAIGGPEDGLSGLDPLWVPKPLAMLSDFHARIGAWLAPCWLAQICVS